MLKVIQIVASVADEAAGPSYSVPRLASAVAGAGAGVSLWALGAPGATGPHLTDVAFRAFRQTATGVPVLGRLRLSTDLDQALRAAAPDVDVMHTHGLWLMPNISPAQIARRAGKAFVLSPRGMLGAAALRFSRRRKQLVWALMQKQAAASAAMLHATSHEECEEIRAMGLVNPVAVIPNGIDVPPLSRPAPGAVRTVLSLGRVHPKKGLDRLIRAWSQLGPEAEGWRLRIVGPSEGGCADDLRALTHALGLQTVVVENSLFGEAKLAAYREADLFALPTLNENFAMTVAEALAAGTPVISTKGAPWAGLEVEGCGWWVDHGEAAMAAALTNAMMRPREDLAAMGERGRAWMQRDFSWDRIGRDMLEAYRWIRLGGDRPATVRT
jgi:glycosyltransferase involved in cell wall biosynthesis